MKIQQVWGPISNYKANIYIICKERPDAIWRYDDMTCCSALRGRFYNSYPLTQDRKIDKMEILVILIIIIRREFYHIIRIFYCFHVSAGLCLLSDSFIIWWTLQSTREMFLIMFTCLKSGSQGSSYPWLALWYLSHSLVITIWELRYQTIE